MTSIPVKQKYEGKIEDIFPIKEDYTFLAGAGISMDPPSNMPSAIQIVKGLLNLCSPPEEIENLLSLKGLRYEMIVEIIQGYFDEDLRFLDYLDIVKEPNLIHLFLSNAINKGNFVLTTNFDFLIERALMRVLPQNLHMNIYPIITKEDFLSFSAPQILVNSGKYPIYKIHGTKKNIITGIDTRESLITTMSSLGREREEGTTFAIEQYKKPAVYNLMKNHTLIALGYSGSDDFDIGPTLKEIPFLNKMIWIEHSMEDRFEVFKFNRVDNIDSLDNYPKLEKLLGEIRFRSDFEVFLIKANTNSLIREILWKRFCPELDISELFQENIEPLPNFNDWIKPIFKDIRLPEKYRLANEIYYELKQMDALQRCAKKGLEISEQLNDLKSKSHFLNYFGLLHQMKGKYEEAITVYSDALKIDEQLEDNSSISSILNNIGSVYLYTGAYDQALECYQKAISIEEQIGDYSGKSTTFNNIGKVYENRGDYTSALKYYDEALTLAGRTGDLDRKATFTNNIGMIYSQLEQYDKALEKYEESLKISEQIGDLYGKLIVTNNIGRIFHEHGQFDRANEHYDQTIDLAEKLGDLSKKAGCISNKGSVLLAQGKIDSAMQNFEEALHIEEQLGDPMMITIYLNNIGMIYSNLEKFDLALENFKKALNLTEELKDIPKTALLFSKIGMCYLATGKLNPALDNYIQAVNLYGELGDLKNKGATLSNIGNIYEKQGNHEYALDIYSETLSIDEELSDGLGIAMDLFSIARIYENMGKIEDALINYQKALNIFQQLEQPQYIEVAQKKVDELSNLQ